MGQDMLHAADIQADAATIYRAISTREGLASFWTTDVEAEPTEGSTARFGFPEAPVDLRMRVERLDPDRRVDWVCLGDFPNWQGTTISWELSPSETGQGTQVLFRQGGWSEDYPELDWARVNFVWGQIVGRLRGYAESGQPQPQFAGASVA